MQPGGSDSYLEQCIAALPPQKREAAWRAFREISETGDDSYLSKLLAVLEANGAYAKRIPKELAEASDKLVRDMTVVIDRLGHEENRRETWVKNAIGTEFQRLGQSLPVGQIISGIANQNQLLDKLRQAASELKEGIKGGWVAFLMAVSFAAGVSAPIWLFWDTYQESLHAREFYDATSAAGFQIRVIPLDTGTRLAVAGPPVKSTNIADVVNGTAKWLLIDYGQPK
jgi:hypothetical protein